MKQSSRWDHLQEKTILWVKIYCIFTVPEDNHQVLISSLQCSSEVNRYCLLVWWRNHIRSLPSFPPRINFARCNRGWLYTWTKCEFGDLSLQICDFTQKIPSKLYWHWEVFKKQRTYKLSLMLAVLKWCVVSNEEKLLGTERYERKPASKRNSGEVISKAGYNYLSWSQRRTQTSLVHVWKMQWDPKAQIYIFISVLLCAVIILAWAMYLAEKQKGDWEEGKYIKKRSI